jgi:epoxyqueuosine reductase
MEWMKRTWEKRINVLKVWDKTKTILVCGIFYSKPKRGIYRIAGYALHIDYHKFLYKKILKVMKKAQEKEKNLEYKIYVDTGPILERFFAMKAGLGFIGKNTMLISFKKGSYILIGISLLNIELEPDKGIEKNFCGKCTKCITACPTAAIVKPFTVDANKCISYHTIENKGEIPDEIKKKMNGWIFGCDICQEVCPWNTQPENPTKDFELHPYIKDFKPDIFLKKPDIFLKNSPLKRAKKEGIIRNIRIAEKIIK